MGDTALAEVVERNIASIEEHRRQAEKRRNLPERVADAITRTAGSLPFICIHAIWFSVWILMNINLFGIPSFDPYPFGLLTTIVSLEAIFLSTFVLVSQNRQSAIADQRAQLDLQINLLAEYEITRILKIQDAIARHLGVDEGNSNELQELEKDVEPEAVLQKLESQMSHASERKPRKSRPGKE